jgi:hypothetical protein
MERTTRMSWSRQLKTFSKLEHSFQFENIKSFNILTRIVSQLQKAASFYTEENILLFTPTVNLFGPKMQVSNIRP